MPKLQPEHYSMLPKILRKGIAPAMTSHLNTTYWGTTVDVNTDTAKYLGCDSPQLQDTEADRIVDCAAKCCTSARQAMAQLRGEDAEPTKIIFPPIPPMINHLITPTSSLMGGSRTHHATAGPLPAGEHGPLSTISSTASCNRLATRAKSSNMRPTTTMVN